MTPQQLFDTVVANLRKQGSKSLLTLEQCRELQLPPGTCAYRGFHGYRCAVGCLISDLDYSQEMEGKYLTWVQQHSPSLAAIIDGQGDNYNLLCDLQSIHDTTIVEEWEERFRRVASQFRLTYTPMISS